MPSIYNIYEQLYQSLLSPIDDTIDKGESDVKKVLNTFKEKLIKIVSLSASFTESDTLTFRNMIDDAIEVMGTNLAHCYMDKKLKNNLIISSKRELTNDDFKGFCFNTKEYSHACSMSYLMFDYICKSPNIDDMISNARKSKGNFIYTNDKMARCICLGNNTIIFQNEGELFIKIKNYWRLVISISDRGTGNNKIDLSHSLI